MRLEKPIGSALLFVPGALSIGMAALDGDAAWLPTMATFALGAVTMRSAGCIINDIWDRNLDGQVARTASRPLPSGRVTVGEAVALLAANLTASLGLLATLNGPTVALGAASLVPVLAYPAMKRLTHWPQLFLGLTFNWGALLGWSAVAADGAIAWPVVGPLYVGCIAWTLLYDTIYALQDAADDVKVGIRSVALHAGSSIKRYLAAFAVVSLAGLSLAGLAHGGLSYGYFGGLVATAAHFAWQIRTLVPGSAADAARKFASNKWVGAFLLAGLALDGLGWWPFA